MEAVDGFLDALRVLVHRLHLLAVPVRGTHGRLRVDCDAILVVGHALIVRQVRHGLTRWRVPRQFSLKSALK